jgi:hypothetical protein
MYIIVEIFQFDKDRKEKNTTMYWWQWNTIPKKNKLWKLKAKKKLRNTKIIQQFNGKQLC